MIDKTYINFYVNWYYKKTGDEYLALEKNKDFIGVITEIRQCPINEFVKKLSKLGEWKSAYDFNDEDFLVIGNKYPWIKEYHREVLISKLRRPIIFSLFVSAIKNEDFTLSEYILKTYNLTENDAKTWKIDTLEKHDTVSLKEIKYGETYYYLKNETDFSGKTITYKKGDKHCLIGNVRCILSEELIKQLDEATKTFDKNINDIFAQTNGFHIADFGNGRFIGYKQLEAGNYYFVVMKKSNEDFTYLYQTNMSALNFLTLFDFVRWGVLGGKFVLDESSLPLYLSAKACGDKFLEYEMKYLNDTATQTELDYLNKNDTFEKVDRFYLKKDIYDLDDIEILKAYPRIMKWVGKVVECEILIDEKKASLTLNRSLNQEQSKLTVYTKDKIFKCKITQRLRDKLIELYNSKINEI